MKKNIPLVEALALMLVWGATTMLGSLIMTGGENVPLEEMIDRQLAYPLLLSAVIVSLYVWIRKIPKQVGVGPKVDYQSWILIYPTVIIVLLLLAFAIYGEANPTTIGWILLNTFFVGISEELMFRGVLLSSLSQKYSFWKTAIIVTLLFGLIHVLNGFITGEFSHSTMQAAMAGFSGLLFLGIRVKTKSIIPAIVLHWFWDMTVFLSMSQITEKAKEEPLLVIILLLAGVSPIVFGIMGIIQCRDKKAVEHFMSTQK
jgi:membrane protease YdiL (CAAX protease family)